MKNMARFRYGSARGGGRGLCAFVCVCVSVRASRSGDVADVISCIAVVVGTYHRHSQSHDAGAERVGFVLALCWVFTDQADNACTKRKSAVRCSASLMKGELHPATNPFVRRTSAPCACFLEYGWQQLAMN